MQEAWLRLRRVEDPAGIRNLGAWLTTTVSRLALDALGRAQVRREGRPRFPPTYAEQRELVAAFAAACTEGDLERLVTLSTPMSSGAATAATRSRPASAHREQNGWPGRWSC